MSDNVKVRVQLHEGEKETTKIWRFDASQVLSYSKERVESENLQLFPHVVSKQMTVEIYHIDEMAGRIDIQSDADMGEALANFKEAAGGQHRMQYLTLFAEDTLKSSTPITKTGCSSRDTTSERRTRKVCSCS